MAIYTVRELRAKIDEANRLAREAQQMAANAREQYKTAKALYEQISEKLAISSAFTGQAIHSIDEQITSITRAIEQAQAYRATT